MNRIDVINAVRGGASVTDTARQFDISRATLQRWLKAFDPDHPVTSLRPQRRGPRVPRGGDEVLLQVMQLIADHPGWWGKRRVARALGERGVTLSEATVGRILVVARQRIEEVRQRETRRQEADARREARVTARQRERDEARRALWQEQLEAAGVFAPGMPVEERFRRAAQALTVKGWRIQVKDLTPELRSLADAYLKHVEIVSPSESWLLNADRRHGAEIDKHRAGALNDLVKKFGPEALPPARISIAASDHRYLDKKDE